LFDLFGRQVAHQIAFCQQLDPLRRIGLFAGQGIFAKLGAVAYRGSLFLQGPGCDVVDCGAGGKSRANENPCRAGVKTLLMERQRAFIGEFDRQRGNQGAGGKCQQTCERAL
jgi:hypothetical protein